MIIVKNNNGKDWLYKFNRMEYNSKYNTLYLDFDIIIDDIIRYGYTFNLKEINIEELNRLTAEEILYTKLLEGLEKKKEQVKIIQEREEIQRFEENKKEQIINYIKEEEEKKEENILKIVEREKRIEESIIKINTLNNSLEENRR